MDGTSASKTRGTVIKIPDATPGIVFANGQQQYFTMERVWKSPVAPAANQTVDVEFDASGALLAITVVDAQSANKEKLNQAGAIAQEKGKEAAKLAQQGIGALAARMGTVPLVLAVVVVIAFFFLPAAEIAGGFVASQWYSFWTLVGIDFNNPATLMGGAGDHGIWSIVGLLAILAPFVAPFIRAAWSKYLNAAPVAYVLIAWLMVYMNTRKITEGFGGESPFSYGWGLYVLVLAALALGAGALKKSTT
jgi:hypothetical protein